ncbi:hypothetical protein R4Z09_26730 [Niallia oryzisoli]|uniref:Uncharacterized protein n=1 Tax=Niallia oryzisoli TaxID=1737571 RepID=A0ABZ2CAK1_9BACI
MLKRLFITILMIQLLLFGSTSAWAHAVSGADNFLSDENVEEIQESEIEVEQKQSVDTDGTADRIEQEQALKVEKSQEQTTPEIDKAEAESVEAENHADVSDEIGDEVQTDDHIATDTEAKTDKTNAAEAEVQTDESTASEEKMNADTAKGSDAENQEMEIEDKAQTEENKESSIGTQADNNASTEVVSQEADDTGSADQTEPNNEQESEESSQDPVSNENTESEGEGTEPNDMPALILEDNDVDEGKGQPDKKDNHLPHASNAYKQEQAIEVLAEQKQTVIEADQVKAEQGQDIAINYNQSLKVTKRDKQSQETTVRTDQEQSFVTENQTDYMEQITETMIDTKQNGMIDQEKHVNRAIQNTNITTAQKHTSETSGNAVILQEQSVEAAAKTKDRNRENASILAKAANGVEIIKDATQTAVKIVQSVIINGQEITAFEQEFSVGTEPVEHTQVFTQTFAWGTLSVLNKAIVSLTEDQDLTSVLESVIKLDFFLPVKKLFDNQQDTSDETCLDSDGDGLTDCEERQIGTDAYNPDTDGDGISDYLEVKVYKTNPLKAEQR